MDTAVVVNEKVKALAKDLRREYPRSPRDTSVGGYVLAARAVDKCRATLCGINGEYNYHCGLDKGFFEFAGIDGDALKAYVATGATDEEISAWIKSQAKQKTEEEVVLWNNQRKGQRMMDAPPRLQVYMEKYIRENLPKGKVVNFVYDVYDIEEKRL